MILISICTGILIYCGVHMFWYQNVSHYLSVVYRYMSIGIWVVIIKNDTLIKIIVLLAPKIW